MSVRLDRQQFDECFQPLIALYPSKRSAWSGDMGQIYHQHLSSYTTVQLTEAIGRLIEKLSVFPSIAQTRAELEHRRSYPTGADAGTSASHLNTAIRVMESRFGKHTALKTAPPWVIECVDQAVELGRQEAERRVAEGGQYSPPDFDELAERFALGTLNVLIVRHSKSKTQPKTPEEPTAPSCPDEVRQMLDEVLPGRRRHLEVATLPTPPKEKVP